MTIYTGCACVLSCIYIYLMRVISCGFQKHLTLKTKCIALCSCLSGKYVLIADISKPLTLSKASNDSDSIDGRYLT